MGWFGNEYAVAGIMGWWCGESSLYPTRCEGDFVKTSAGYPKSNTITARIDAGKGTADGKAGFTGSGSSALYRAVYYVNGHRYGPGYGLAQWTGETRKVRMWNAWNNPRWIGHSISSTEFQCYWCYAEMRTYMPQCYNKMIHATSVRQAMWDFGYWFETGGNTSWTNQIVPSRIGYGNKIYSIYAGSTPGGTPDPPIDTDPDYPDIDDPGWDPRETFPAWLAAPVLQRKEHGKNVKRFFKLDHTNRI